MSQGISNWGNYPIVHTDEKSFSSMNQLNALIQSEEGAIARGLGRCYGDASLSDSSLLSTLKFNKILQFDNQTGIFEAQSGISFEKILEIVVPKGWFLPVSPGTKYITLGGAVASDVHGKNHHGEGSFSNYVLELSLLNADGNILICSPNQNGDLFWATCGGMGLTGIIISVRFRLKKIETSFIKKLEIKAKNLDHIISLFEEYKSYTYSMAWIDCLKGGNQFGRSIMMAGEHALLQELDSKKSVNPLALPDKPKLSIPFYFPDFTLNTLSVKAFNFLYYNVHPSGKSEKIVLFDPFFYPLDSILNWNRMYGKKGFVQYQFVIPFENSRKGLVDILSKIRNKGMGSFLAVLKLFGPQNGLISFPIEGYTLALDFPITRELFPFLDILDKIVLDYGGRIYLTKDARMGSEMFWRGYENASQFKSIIEKYNPQGFFSSLQSKRLLITQN